MPPKPPDIGILSAAQHQIRSIKDGGHRKILPEWVDDYIRYKVEQDKAA
jgi:hypothetical protein